MLREPEHACPSIDAAIDRMEEARKIAESLREWGHDWKTRAEESEEDLETLKREYDDLEKENQQLRGRISQLEDELEAAVQ